MADAVIAEETEVEEVNRGIAELEGKVPVTEPEPAAAGPESGSVEKSGDTGEGSVKEVAEGETTETSTVEEGTGEDTSGGEAEPVTEVEAEPEPETPSPFEVENQRLKEQLSVNPHGLMEGEAEFIGQRLRIVITEKC